MPSPGIKNEKNVNSENMPIFNANFVTLRVEHKLKSNDILMIMLS